MREFLPLPLAQPPLTDRTAGVNALDSKEMFFSETKRENEMHDAWNFFCGNRIGQLVGLKTKPWVYGV